MKKAVVFDMDGVIFDTENLVLSCWKIIGDKYGFERVEEVFQQCIGVNTKESNRIAKENLGEDFEYERFRPEVRQLFEEKTREKGIPVKRGARELLSYLKVNGYRIGLASSTEKKVVEAQLEQAGLLRFFQVVIGGDMVTNSKPHPEIYVRACEALGVQPQDAYAIEDSYHGVRSAHAAGMDVIMVPDLLEPDDEMREIAVIYPSLMAVLGYFQNL